MTSTLRTGLASLLLTLLTGACDMPTTSDAGSAARDASLRDASLRDAATGRDGSTTTDGGGPLEDDSVTTPDAGVPGALDPRLVQGFGAVTSGGAGGETCMVTTLANSGEGSLRACVRDRTGAGEDVTPRVVRFAVAGTIVLASDLVIDRPYLTIDGSTAPAPGITIQKVTPEDGEVTLQNGANGVAHDVIVRYLRFDGGWNRVDETTSNNSGTIKIDGENTAEPVSRIVFDHLVLTNATDAAGDIWGRAEDITYQWCLFLRDLHPITISHSGDEQARQRISLHHNVFAYNHERNPQVRGRVVDLDYVNNVVVHWARLSGGYGVRFREIDGTVPTRIMLIENFFASDTRPGSAILYEPNPLGGEVFARGNVTPTLRNEDLSSVTAAFDRPENVAITSAPVAELREAMLPFVGLPSRTAEEQAAIDEAASLLGAL